MATIGEMIGGNKRFRWADLADSSTENLLETPDVLRSSSHVPSKSPGDTNKRPRWADLADSSTEQLPVMPDALRSSLSFSSNHNDDSVPLADSQSLSDLRRALSSTMNEVCAATASGADEDGPHAAAEGKPVGKPLATSSAWPTQRHSPPRRSPPRDARMKNNAASPPKAWKEAQASMKPKPSAAPTPALVETPALNASDQEWQRRAEKRLAIVAVTKDLPAYQACLARRQLRRERRQRSRSPSAPPTPDATDRDISKRTWEKLIADWRHHFKDTAPGVALAAA